MSYFVEPVTNTVARRSSGGERSKWRDQGVDPELLGSVVFATGETSDHSFDPELVLHAAKLVLEGPK